MHEQLLQVKHFKLIEMTRLYLILYNLIKLGKKNYTL